MSTQNCTGIEVTIAAILAAQECGDHAAIEAARIGGSAWDDYLASYVGNYTHNEFTLAPLTQPQSAELRWQVLEQAALLPNNRVREGTSLPRHNGEGREWTGIAGADAAEGNAPAGSALEE